MAYNSKYTGAEIERTLDYINKTDFKGETGAQGPQGAKGDPGVNATTTNTATYAGNGLMSSTDKSILDFGTGYNTVTTLASLPVNKRTIVATLSSASAIGLLSGLLEGQELMIRVNPTASFTLPLPNSGGWTSMSGTSVACTNGVPVEISIWCYQTGYYSIVVKTKD